MKRITLLMLGTIGVVLAASAGKPRRRRGAPLPEPSPEHGKFQWVDADAPRRIRKLAKPIEELANWPGLGDYLAAISYTESRGNSQAGNSGENNYARGWFGIRPKSARLAELGLGVEALKDEPTTVALAAWYAVRCRAYASKGQVVTWLAVRRCWGFPKDLPNEEHPGYKKQLARGLAAVGLPRAFMDKRAFPGGFDWPGVEQVLEAVRKASVVVSEPEER